MSLENKDITEQKILEKELDMVKKRLTLIDYNLPNLNNEKEKLEIEIDNIESKISLLEKQQYNLIPRRIEIVARLKIIENK